MSITSKANTESIFTWVTDANNRTYLSVEHAVLMYKNFEGRPDRFNIKGGKRTFNLVLSNEAAKELKELGWNVKEKAPRDIDEDWLYTTEIVVNMDSQYPPKMYICTEKNGKKRMIRLDADMVKELDTGEFSNIDVVINPYEHDKDARFRYKGYCHKLFATQAVSTDFGDKYADYELANDPAIVAHPSEDDDDGDLPF